MITMCLLYNDFKGASNTWQGGHFRPLSFEWAVYEAILEIFNEHRKIWEESQIVTDTLLPYFKRAQLQVKNYNEGGLVPYPKDYSSFSSLRYFSRNKKGGTGKLCGDLDIMDKDTQLCRPLRPEEKAAALASIEELHEQTITKVDNMRWGSVAEHEFLAPSINNVYSTQYGNGFKVLPKRIGTVVLDYLAKPERAAFIYTKDPRHNIICDPEKCGKILFGDEILPELMARIKTKYASFIKDQGKYAEAMKETNSA